MRKLTILTLVAIFLTAACISTIQPAKASTEEVATSVSIMIQPENIVPGQPFTVVVQINPHPPSNNDVFYNVFVTVISAAQGISGYGPWSAGPSSSDVNGVASFTFPGAVSATLGETGGGNIEVSFPGQYFGNTTMLHYQAGNWQKNFFVAAAQTPTPAATSPSPNTESTPNQLTPPSTIAPPKNFTVAPLSSLNLKVSLQYGESCGGSIIIKGGSGNDINFRIIDPHGKIYLDFSRISNEKSFQFFTPNRPGNFTFVFDNEFSVVSSKEVDVFSNTYPDNPFVFAGFSINLWVIISVAISLTLLTIFVVLILKKKRRA